MEPHVKVQELFPIYCNVFLSGLEMKGTTCLHIHAQVIFNIAIKTIGKTDNKSLFLFPFFLFAFPNRILECMYTHFTGIMISGGQHASNVYYIHYNPS